MRIKLYILESDTSYLERISTVFGTKFAEKLMVSTFTDQDIALESLARDRADVFLAGDEFVINQAQVPDYTAFAYLTDSAMVESIRGEQTICRFQKADLIYKEILSLYSDNSSALISLTSADSQTQLFAFLGAAGGTGVSTMAAACAMRLSQLGKPTLFLDLHEFSDAEAFFQADGAGSFADVLFSIKRRKSNLGLKIESLVRQDASGAFFFSSTDHALDMASMTHDEQLELLDLIKSLNRFEYVIVDMPFDLSEECQELIEQMHRLIFVLDGRDVSNKKFERALLALQTLEDTQGLVITPKLTTIYNAFSSRYGQRIGVNVKSLGGAGRYEGASSQEIARELSLKNEFDQLISK